MTQSTHNLGPEEQRMLTQANRLLTQLTVPHSATCTCELCKARILTDVQDKDSFRVPYTPAGM